MQVDTIPGDCGINSSDDDDFGSLAMELSQRQTRSSAYVGDVPRVRSRRPTEEYGLLGARVSSRRATRDNDEFSFLGSASFLRRSGSRRATRDGECGEVSIGASLGGAVGPALGQISPSIQRVASAHTSEGLGGVRDGTGKDESGGSAAFRRSSLAMKPPDAAGPLPQAAGEDESDGSATFRGSSLGRRRGAEPPPSGDVGDPLLSSAGREGKLRRNSWLSRAWASMTEHSHHGLEDSEADRLISSIHAAGLDSQRFRQRSSPSFRKNFDQAGPLDSGGEPSDSSQSCAQAGNLQPLSHARARRHSSAIPSASCQASLGVAGLEGAVRRTPSMPGADLVRELLLQPPSFSGRSSTSRRRRMSLPGPPCLDPVSGLPIAPGDDEEEGPPGMNNNSFSLVSSTAELAGPRVAVAQAPSEIAQVWERDREALGLMMKADAFMAGGLASSGAVHFDLASPYKGPTNQV